MAGGERGFVCLISELKKLLLDQVRCVMTESSEVPMVVVASKVSSGKVVEAMFKVGNGGGPDNGWIVKANDETAWAIP
ncbi:hypothetical protein Acr_24g0015650 [Actinidia rufa]|uniref:Uncharacterized protein n=1 Tax=Actinidia rufa TaxID=165716 RepID=A0A7J0GX06_9ERIC|nr:hypothetical protein Acr_24g0015650 [Actinidia rufa]